MSERREVTISMKRPLIVDLDGTLLRTDSLFEALMIHVKKTAGAALQLPKWLMSGKASFKEQLAMYSPLDVAFLPYNQEILSFLRQQKQQGRFIVLATAAHRTYADQIAGHLGLFDQVFATDRSTNLSAASKRDKLVSEFGEKGFDYIGNSHDDITVWASANKSYLADPDFGVERRARRIGDVEQVFRSRRSTISSWIRALRPHQWVKNLLVFIPLLAAHEFSNFSLVFHVLMGFVFFDMIASSGYLINDLFDLENDRQHPRKRRRPMASGDLPLLYGILSAPVLFVLAFLGSLVLLPGAFTLSLLIYYVLTIAYSRSLKRIMALDTIVLAGLYTVRIIGGAYACALVPTFWILAFSMFLFLSLAMLKRYAELLGAYTNGETAQTKGRGYVPSDLGIVANLGIAAGYLSVLVLALYIQDVRTVQMYHASELIWLACPLLLFWISRIWMITHRGLMDDDPVLFAIKDRVSLLIGAMFAFVFILAAVL